MKITITLIGIFICLNQLKAQTSSFSFSAAAHATTGWINLAGDPSLAVITASDPSTGIGISSVATANWYPYNRTNAAYDGGGVNTDGFFPGTVLYNQWFQYDPAGEGLSYYNQAIPQFIISGLNAGSLYTIKLSGSNAFGFDSHDTRYTVAGVIVYPPMDLNTTNNTANGSTFNNIAPDVTGKIMVYVNTVGNTELADISGLQIITTTTTTPTPLVSFTSPHNNDLVPEDGNLVLTATASETSGSIAKVQFYRDTLLLGEALTPPYTFTWATPDPGSYTLIAKALDNLGGSAYSTIHVTVQSLNYFWSTTGNIATGGDTSFVGTVDSNRLAFRTKNIERMSISPTGNVGIGTKTPLAQLHTTGSVRFDQFKNNSAGDSVLTTDSSGNMRLKAIQLAGGLGGRINILPRDSFQLSFSADTGRTYGFLDFYGDNIFGAYNGGVLEEGLISNRIPGKPDRMMIQFLPSNTATRSPAQTNIITSSLSTNTGAGAEFVGGTPQVNPFAGIWASDSTYGSSIGVLPRSVVINSPAIQLYDLWNRSNQVLTTDTAGFLILKPLSAFGSSSNWLLSGTTAYDSLDNIGIGTSNTHGYKLAVNGTGIFTQIKVKPFISWPDYVFRKDYKLTGLKQLESYIAGHRHLPGLPSAEEVQKEGQDLGKIQAELLEKMEEMTLYMIELNKKVDVLTKENQQLKKHTH